MSDKTSPIWHPFTQHGLMPHSIHVEHASGAHIYAKSTETQEIQKIIDGISSWWVITHGHCNPTIVKAVKEQAATLDQVIFAGFTHQPAEMLAEKLLRFMNEPLSHVFYSDSGSTAVEVALKMAIGYWAQTGRPRQKIIAFEGGYHGDTFGTMSAGGRSVYNKIYEPFLFDVIHIPVPVPGEEEKSFEALEKILKEQGDDIAAFIFEPLVLGAGGMQIYSAENLKKLTSLCREKDVLLIADEVMTGFGRTGTLFACEQAGFTPDLLCLSKGLTGGFLPMGVTVCTEDIYRAFYHKDKSKMFFHSSSFTGNPMACAAAVASLSIWENEDVLEKINTIAHHHKQAAKEFAVIERFENIRQAGTILALDIKDDNAGYLSEIQPKLYDHFLSRNILLRPLGNTIYILPPYCTSPADLTTIYDAIKETLDLS